MQDSLAGLQKHVHVFDPVAKSGFQFIKMHIMSHYPEQIRRYGSPRGSETELGELLHKEFIKRPYRMTNKKKIEKQVFAVYSIVRFALIVSL